MLLQQRRDLLGKGLVVHSYASSAVVAKDIKQHFCLGLRTAEVKALKDVFVATPATVCWGTSQAQKH
jgi:hypothetical protein